VDKQLNKIDNHFLGSGWSFPVTFSAGNYQLNMTSFEENISNSINTILLTRKGERTLEPDFGSGIQKFFFRKMDEGLKSEIINAIKFSLLQNEPRITVVNVVVDYADVREGLAEVTITYKYNQTNTRHNYVFPFHLNEGTNL